MNKEELRQFIDFKTICKEVDLSEFKVWVDFAHNWQVELGCINYLLSQILEKKAKDGEECLSVVELIYELEDKLFFRIHECDYKFVEYMLRNLRQFETSLEDELVTLHNNMCEHIYEQTLRY